MTTEDAVNLSPEQLAQVVKQLQSSGVLDQMLDQRKAELAEELTEQMQQNRFTGEDMEGVENGLGSGGFPWRYWRRRDGRVIIGPEPRETMYPIYVRKQYEPLFQYGNLPTPGSPVSCCPNLQMKDNELHILMARGGAKEIAISQIINAGWHIHPPVIHGKTIVFPQLAGVEIETVECPECDKPIHGRADSQEIIVRMRQHGRGAHSWTRKETTEALVEVGYLKQAANLGGFRRFTGGAAGVQELDIDDADQAEAEARERVRQYREEHREPAMAGVAAAPQTESEPESQPAVRVTKGATGKN